MKNVLRNFFSTMPPGARALLLVYALALPLAMLGHWTGVFDLRDWLALSPAKVWRGEVWRLVTYAFLPGGILDCVISLFWLATLVSVLGRNWSGRQLWGYCLLCALAGAVPLVLLEPEMTRDVVGCYAMIFGLVVAWDRLYRRERLILLGVGEISVRQAAILVAVIQALVLLLSCLGWLFTLSMMCGGVAGWVYLSLRTKLTLRKPPGPVASERIVRLEL